MEFKNKIVYYKQVFLKKLQHENKSKNTIATYDRIYKNFIEFIECYADQKILTFYNINEIDIYEFLAYKEGNLQKQGGLSISTKQIIITALKRLFRYIEQNEKEEAFDFDTVFRDIKFKKKKTVPKALTKQQQDLLLNYLEELKGSSKFTDIRNILLIKMFLYGGFRTEEIQSIKISDFILCEDEDSFFCFHITGKGEKSRVVYIKSEFIEDEVEELSNFLDKNDYIAVRKSKEKMFRTELYKMATSIYKRAGLNLTGGGLHILRHTFAQNLLSDGVAINIVQALLGHSNIQTTMVYTSVKEEMILNELSKKLNKN